MTEKDKGLEQRYSAWLTFLSKNGFEKKHATLLTDYAVGLEKKQFPVIFELEHLSKILGMEYSLLSRMTGANSYFYRDFKIKKRNGGTRTIQSPYPKLAYTQQWIKKHILDKICISDHAFAYAKGKSHIENAKQHIGSGELLKIDLVNFFDHIDFKSVYSIFFNCGYSEKVSTQLAKLCTIWDRLPQGAPTSPVISNIILKEIDHEFSLFSAEHGLIYTRYADDICISGQEISLDFILNAKNIIESNGFLVNPEKTCLVKGSARKLITGVQVNDFGVRAPKKLRREYRKSAYFLIKNNFSSLNGTLQPLNPTYIDEVYGKGQYILSIEPENNKVIEYQLALKKLKNKLMSSSS
ncbi:reverse transcriptase family protein [Aeromonas media]|uniref:RNA-directed DNA polymerase n=1 Tax=Aeromonas media TaxID=651 RepID=A0AAP6GAB8_AERME|nr:reverse transcriptase family protein [Aeromonas media]MDX7921937.1 reverse transcriptase family protein [Aeromonas media]